jgi:hypothetical protein
MADFDIGLAQQPARLDIPWIDLECVFELDHAGTDIAFVDMIPGARQVLRIGQGFTTCHHDETGQQDGHHAMEGIEPFQVCRHHDSFYMQIIRTFM